MAVSCHTWSEEPGSDGLAGQKSQVSFLLFNDSLKFY